MTHMGAQKADIHQMPRGGPDASWLDRLLETDRPEYLDRDDAMSANARWSVPWSGWAIWSGTTRSSLG